MNELEIAIIGFAIGYFWAMWRKDNIKVKAEVTTKLDIKEFWRQAEEWRERQEKKPSVSSVAEQPLNDVSIEV